MKLFQNGVMYFPRIFSEGQCCVCSKILQWEVINPGREARAECCGKIFNVFLNYVNVKIEDKLLLPAQVSRKKKGKHL